MNLEVEGFEIEPEILCHATKDGAIGKNARWIIARTAIAALTLESKKRFEEYQEQNDPCGVR